MFGRNAGIAEFHALHFALDICNMPSLLFMGLPAMMQNSAFNPTERIKGKTIIRAHP
jgi:hypothetical protein